MNTSLGRPVINQHSVILKSLVVAPFQHFLVDSFLLKIEAKFELKDLHFTITDVSVTLLPPLFTLYQKHKQSQSRATNCMATTYLELSLREPFTDTHVHCILLQLSSLILLRIRFNCAEFFVGVNCVRSLVRFG